MFKKTLKVNVFVSDLFLYFLVVVCSSAINRMERFVPQTTCSVRHETSAHSLCR